MTLTDTDTRRGLALRIATAALVVVALSGVVTAAAAVVTAHNVGELCAEHVTSWPGQGAPCW